MQREDTWAVSVTVDGRPLGIFDKMEGGTVDSEETIFRPGGMASQISLGGARTVDNVTVSRIYDPFLNDSFAFLAARAGVAPMVVTRQPLDRDGTPNGRPTTMSGVLKSVKAPEVDSMGSDQAMMELEMTCQGAIT